MYVCGRIGFGWVGVLGGPFCVVFHFISPPHPTPPPNNITHQNQTINTPQHHTSQTKTTPPPPTQQQATAIPLPTGAGAAVAAAVLPPTPSSSSAAAAAPQEGAVDTGHEDMVHDVQVCMEINYIYIHVCVSVCFMCVLNINVCGGVWGCGGVDTGQRGHMVHDVQVCGGGCFGVCVYVYYIC